MCTVLKVAFSCLRDFLEKDIFVLYEYKTTDLFPDYLTAVDKTLDVIPRTRMKYIIGVIGELDQSTG
jgi:hypothetical protein